jgi:uncharacterized protein with ParB-like and HNH nuclease domain
MKAQDLQFTQLLQGAKQFIIPIFQRTYGWEVGHCQQLWDDIMRVGSHAELDSHFIGSAKKSQRGVRFRQWATRVPS